MNHRLLPVVVFMTLMLTSLLTGCHNYQAAKSRIVADLNRALTLTVKEKGDNLITQDTIRAYRQLRQHAGGRVAIALADKKFCRHLKDKRLRDSSFITFDVVDNRYSFVDVDGPVVCSDTLLVRNARVGETLAFRSYARLSSAAILGMSDQRMPVALMMTAMLWVLCFRQYMRRMRGRQPFAEGFGGLVYSETDGCFYDVRHESIHFTPMQKQLVLMFWNAPSHSLSKEEICAALWPKKDDANDTLYTLIRRVKPIIEAHTNLKIVADRGRNYSLIVNELKR